MKFTAQLSNEKTEELYQLLWDNKVEEFNKWRLKHPGIRLDLSGRKLIYCNLPDALLFNINFEGAWMEGIQLQRAILCNSNLNNCNFRRGLFIQTVFGIPELINMQYPESVTQHFVHPSTLIDARFEDCVFVEANLTGCNITDANLRDASFGDCDLSQTNMTNVILERTYFQKTKLPESFNDAQIVKEINKSVVIKRKKG